MDLRGWDERYRSGAHHSESPNSLVVKTAEALNPGRALDLACGTGRNALWLAAHGWDVTAIDGSIEAIQLMRHRAEEMNISVDAQVADLLAGQYSIEPEAFEFICICYYLQRDLFAPAMRGVVPGGLLLAIVHITEGGEKPTAHRLRPGELAEYFREWEILHWHEGNSQDPAHQRASAEIVARRLMG